MKKNKNLRNLEVEVKNDIIKKIKKSILFVDGLNLFRYTLFYQQQTKGVTNELRK